MLAIKVTTDNELSVVTVPEPTYKGLAELVNGDLFEVVKPRGLKDINIPYKNLLMVVDEEGRYIDKAYNKLGSELYNGKLTSINFEPIVGDILIMAEGIVDGEPDIVGLEERQLIIVFKALKSKFEFLKEKKCRVCGCTDIEACPGGCYWVEDDLCSECVETGEEIEREDD